MVVADQTTRLSDRSCAPVCSKNAPIQIIRNQVFMRLKVETDGEHDGYPQAGSNEGKIT